MQRESALRFMQEPPWALFLWFKGSLPINSIIILSQWNEHMSVDNVAY